MMFVLKKDITKENLKLLYRTKIYFFCILLIIIKVIIHFAMLFFPILVSSNSNAYESVKIGSAFQRERKPSDGTDDLQLSSVFGSG